MQMLLHSGKGLGTVISFLFAPFFGGQGAVHTLNLPTYVRNYIELEWKLLFDRRSAPHFTVAHSAIIARSGITNPDQPSASPPCFVGEIGRNEAERGEPGRGGRRAWGPDCLTLMSFRVGT